MSVWPNLAWLNGTGFSLAPFPLASLPCRDRRCGSSSASLTDKPRRVSTKAQHFRYRSARIWAHSMGKCHVVGGRREKGGGSESHLWRTMSNEGSNERFEGVSCRRKRLVTRWTVLWASAPFKVHWNYSPTLQGKNPLLSRGQSRSGKIQRAVLTTACIWKTPFGTCRVVRGLYLLTLSCCRLTTSLKQLLTKLIH